MTQASKKHPDDDPGRFAYQGLDRVFHEKARLGITTSLATKPEGIVFTDLKHLVGLTDGNLNRHLAVLEEAGLIESMEIKKKIDVKRPVSKRGKRPTRYKLTRQGRRRYMEYIDQLEQVLRDAEAASNAVSARATLA